VTGLMVGGGGGEGFIKGRGVLVAQEHYQPGRAVGTHVAPPTGQRRIRALLGNGRSIASERQGGEVGQTEGNGGVNVPSTVNTFQEAKNKIQ